MPRIIRTSHGAELTIPTGRAAGRGGQVRAPRRAAGQGRHGKRAARDAAITALALQAQGVDLQVTKTTHQALIVAAKAVRIPTKRKPANG